ncbi:MAG: threonine synthase [Flammeovirgaceae bacterium]
MELYSTKNKSLRVPFKEAVLKGLPSDNGLFMPHQLNPLPQSFFERIDQMSFAEISVNVAQNLIGDAIPTKKLRQIVEETVNFEAPVVPIHDRIYALELFHGPTLAFKDFGARFMARVMSYFMEGEARKLHILVATSGDTGGAVGRGFLGAENIQITILYPKGKVSELQEKQLTTLGQNVQAIEVDGTFDDCQHLVKTAFLDQELNDELLLSSANSINISRLIPQSFYYFWAYAQLKKQNDLPVVFCVPSGNFGNICGGLIAMRMGLPVYHFVAATNANRVFTDYVQSGDFVPKPSVRTLSNAMDVGNPSNFYRLTELFDNEFKAILHKVAASSYSDEETTAIMKVVYEQHQYTLDPHGAVGYLGLRDFMAGLEESVNGVFLETAHPAKFLDVVEATLERKVEIPPALADLTDKEKVAVPLKNSFEAFKDFLLCRV